MRSARFRVAGRFDGVAEATVTDHRGAGVFSVRPLRRRRTYELPLAVVAELVMWRILKAETAQKNLRRRCRR